MDLAEGFLQDIIERPDDDVPRLVYADWLDEHGDPARAEFIRLQCQFDQKEEVYPRARLLSQREEELLETNRERFLGPLAGLFLKPDLSPVPNRSHRFRRGFVEYVYLTRKEFLDRADILFRVTPLRQLKLNAEG